MAVRTRRRVREVSAFGLGRIYQRVAGDRFVKGLAGFKGRRLVKARSLLPTRLQPPVVVVGHGVRLRLTRDPLDAKIVRSVTAIDRHVYFPKHVGDPSSVRLVVDLGAHHGIYTAVAARTYPAARILAVEPSLDALVELRRQIEVNAIGDRVEVVPAALGARAGVVLLSHEASGSWGATLQSPATTTSTEPVVALTLAEILGDRVPDVVKCNAEGAEYALAAQLDELVRRPPVVVLAVHPEYGDVDDLRTRMQALGYAVRVVIDGDRPVWVCSLPRSPG